MKKSIIFGCDSVLPDFITQVQRGYNNYIYDEVTGAIKVRFPELQIDQERLEKWVKMCLHLERLDKEELNELGLRKKIVDKDHQIKVLEKALELACDKIRDSMEWFYDFKTDKTYYASEFEQAYKDIAEKEVVTCDE